MSGEKPTPEIEVFLLFEDLLNFSKELEEPDKMVIFAELQREFEDQQLFQEINNDDKKYKQQSIV